MTPNDQPAPFDAYEFIRTMAAQFELFSPEIFELMRVQTRIALGPGDQRDLLDVTMAAVQAVLAGDAVEEAARPLTELLERSAMDGTTDWRRLWPHYRYRLEPTRQPSVCS